LIVQGDLLSVDLRPLVKDVDAVIHAATSIPRDRSAPGAWDLNTRLRTEGTRRLLAVMGRRRYVQQSIVMAYADGGDTLLDESWPLDTSPERASVVDPVRAMESLVQSSEADWVILRGGLFAPIHVGTVPCDGSYFISPIHPADYARAIVLALDLAPTGSTFNITADPIRMRDLAPDAPLDPTQSCPPSHRCTSSLAHRVLGWRPVHSIYFDQPTPT
jgi:nucleoside-diphosphate-sugar epimerase